MDVKITKDNLVVELAAEQLKRIGFKGNPYEEIKRSGWYKDNQWPDEAMQSEFKKWAVKQISKVYKWNKAVSEKEFAWFDMAYGLNIPENNI